jgi:hypothetical protein
MYRRNVPDETHDENQKNAPDEPQYEGVVFSDGRVAVRWLTAVRSVSVWDSMDDLLKIHGHPEFGSELEWGASSDELKAALAECRSLREDDVRVVFAEMKGRISARAELLEVQKELKLAKAELKGTSERMMMLETKYDELRNTARRVGAWLAGVSFSEEDSVAERLSYFLRLFGVHGYGVLSHWKCRNGK